MFASTGQILAPCQKKLNPVVPGKFLGIIGRLPTTQNWYKYRHNTVKSFQLEITSESITGLSWLQAIIMKSRPFYCLLLLAVVGETDAAVNERAVLLEFFGATGGHAWNDNYGWGDEVVDICNWYGVVCAGETLGDRRAEEAGKVVGLQLSNNFVTGRTPASFWTLPALQDVDLSDNPHLDVDFTGLQQQESSPLKKLQLRRSATTNLVGLAGSSDTLVELDLSETRLDSKLPPDLYSLTQLSTLKLAKCGLLGSLPADINRLSVLRELNIYENALTGTLPEEFSRLVHLRHLTLSFNQFHGTLPQYLNNFLLLREIWAHDNDFTGPIPSFNQAPDIHKIYLNDNSLTGLIPADFIQATIGGMREFQSIYVNLASNALTGTVPETLDTLEDLEIVWMLGDNEWSGIPQTLCDNANWNEGAVEKFDCDGFLCPPETFSRHGFRTPDADCQSCQSAKFYGATGCFDKDDRSVLVELYVELRGEKWERSDNWLTKEDFCTWYGIECWNIGDSKTGRVRKILLPNNGLVGTIPETIYSMHHLTTVDFSRNEIVLPFKNFAESLHMFSVNIARTKTKDFDGIERATDFFHELFADQTPLSGTIPTEIMAIGNLRVLSLQECDLSGEIPDELFNLVKLQELYLSNNNLQGIIPDRWNELESLQVLALAKNQFRGPIPSTFDQAASLTSISLQDQISKGGGLSGSLLPMPTTNTIRTFLLGHNKLEGDLPENLLTTVEGDLPITVDLTNNLMTGKIHGTYNRFNRLNLYLEGNFITEVEETLCSQENWMQGSVGQYGCDAILCPAGTMGGRRQYMDSVCEPCDHTKTPAIVSYLGQGVCSKDENLIMSERDILELLFDQCGGTGWHASSSWMTETSICDWYGIGCDENGSVTSIQLGGNQLVGSVPTEIYQLPNLMHLKLYSNTLIVSFEGIENAKKLKTLGLDNTGLTSLKGIGRARSLHELNVAFNQISGAIPEEISRLINLRNLDISRNKLSGFLPYWLRSLVSLTTFSASHNKFSGPVYDFASLNDLIYLDLSFNKLTGSIPTTLFTNTATEEKLVADFSSNLLVGTLPAELARHPRLSLQVQDNQITGVNSELCQVEGWNDFAVKNYGCDAILCPVGTWNHLGRQSSDDSPCTSCRKAKFMGTTRCEGSSAASTTGVTLAICIIGVVFWIPLL